MTPCNNFVFIPNGLPSLFAKRPEMNCPLPPKISPIEGGMGHIKPFGSIACHFVFFRHRCKEILDWALPSRVVLLYIVCRKYRQTHHRKEHNLALLLEIMHCVRSLQISIIC